MGKASRRKAERKAGGFDVRSAQEIADAIFKNDPRLNTGYGGQLMIKNFNGAGAILTGEAAVRDYWETVCEAMRGDNAVDLPGMAEFGKFMGLSLLDVEIPIIESGKTVRTMLPMLDALFVLRYTECFEWILKFLGTTTRAEKSRLTYFVQCLAAIDLEDDPQRLAMAKTAIRVLLEFFDESGMLNPASQGIGFRFDLFHEVFNDYQLKKLAAVEFDEIRQSVVATATVQPSNGVRRV